MRVGPAGVGTGGGGPGPPDPPDPPVFNHWVSVDVNITDLTYASGQDFLIGVGDNTIYSFNTTGGELSLNDDLVDLLALAGAERVYYNTDNEYSYVHAPDVDTIAVVRTTFGGSFLTIFGVEVDAGYDRPGLGGSSSDDLLFVRKDSGIDILDVTTTANPADLGFLSSGASVQYGGFHDTANDRLLAVGPSNLAAVDISTPSAPAITGTPYTPSGVTLLAGKASWDSGGDVIYVPYRESAGGSGGGIRAIDVSSTSPSLLDEIDLGAYPLGTTFDAANDVLYSAGAGDNVHVISTTSPSSLSLSDTITDSRGDFLGPIQHDPILNLVYASFADSSGQAYIVTLTP